MLYISYFEVSKIYGHGNRLAIWFSGCNLKCKNCWNKKIQFKKNGTPYTVIDLTNKILTFENIKGLTFLGSEPLQQYKRFTISMQNN